MNLVAVPLEAVRDAMRGAARRAFVDGMICGAYVAGVAIAVALVYRRHRRGDPLPDVDACPDCDSLH